MNIVWRIMRRLADDISMFGTAAALHNIGRTVNRRPFALSVPGFAPIFVRRGDSDYSTVMQTLGRREYSVDQAIQDRILARYRQILDTGQVPVIIDAGANIGVAAIWFRSIYADAHIVAIEPDPANVEIF